MLSDKDQTVKARPAAAKIKQPTYSAERELERPLSIAVIIPCYNEEVAIGATVAGFKAALPSARVYVYDNNSTDQTSAVALAAGATVRREPRKGKGNVVRRMFADVDADLYVLTDGDATYDPASAPEMIRMLVQENMDMVVGCRVDQSERAYRAGHRLGNAMLTGFLAWLFGRAFSDTLSGYRVFSRRFVKSFPSLSSGFEIETEINVHALELKMPSGEVMTKYNERMEGSQSKLNTYGDGIRILGLMLALFRREKPATFFSLISVALVVLAVVLFFPLGIEFIESHQVPRIPTAILCTGLVILAMLSMSCGLILDTVTHGRREIRRLAYLNFTAPQ
jgi:glycosyltransferase involved in cell wall biosynthesis